LVSICWAADPATLADPKAKASYSLGYDFGANLRKQEVAVDPEVLLAAVRDGLEGKTPPLAVDDMREILEDLRRKVQLQEQRRAEKAVAENFAAGKAYLEANKSREGVKTLPSGLQYKVLHEGSGSSPTVNDRVAVNYRGTLVDGKEFDNSTRRGRPTVIPVQGVIRGWTEALLLMKPGDKWEIVVPPDLAYGKRVFGRIPPESTLIFELELVSIGEGDGSKAFPQ
jgi:FKBP-type peptidyl-prolyl cis-trans isomerase FklB